MAKNEAMRQQGNRLITVLRYESEISVGDR